MAARVAAQSHRGGVQSVLVSNGSHLARRHASDRKTLGSARPSRQSSQRETEIGRQRERHRERGASRCVVAVYGQVGHGYYKSHKAPDEVSLAEVGLWLQVTNACAFKAFPGVRMQTGRPLAVRSSVWNGGGVVVLAGSGRL